MRTAICRDAQGFDLHIARFLRRFVYVNHSNMATFAESLAAFLRVGEIPRDPFLALADLGIELQPAALSRASRSLWVKTNNRYCIHYSKYEPRAAVRFSLWHEFFEILAAHPLFPSLYSPNRRERLADRFAALMLMPERCVINEARRFATNAAGLAAVLADRFGVSLAAMRRRLREIAPEYNRFAAHPRAWTGAGRAASHIFARAARGDELPV